MEKFNLSQENIKLALSSSAGVYLTLGALVLGLGVLHVINSVPLLGPGLEVLGLIYAYNNRGTFSKKVLGFLKPTTEAAARLVSQK